MKTLERKIVEFTSFDDLKMITFDGEYIHIFESNEKIILLITKNIWFKLQEEFFNLKNEYYKNYNKSYCGIESISFSIKNSKKNINYLTSWENENDEDNIKPIYEKIPAYIVIDFELEMEHG